MLPKYALRSFGLAVVFVNAAMAQPLETGNTVPSPMLVAYHQDQADPTRASRAAGRPPVHVQASLRLIPAEERTSTILNLLCQTDIDADLRSGLTYILKSQPVGPQGIQSKHLLQLTRLYITTINRPLSSEAPSDRFFLSDGLIRITVLRLLGSFLDCSDSELEYTDRTPAQVLDQFFGLAKQRSKDAELTAQIQICQDALHTAR